MLFSLVTGIRIKVRTFTAEPAKSAEKSLKKLCGLCGLGGKNGDSHVCPKSCPNFNLVRLELVSSPAWENGEF
jgi:hypothetical protein